MVHKRKKIARVRTAEQIRVLASPASIEIIHALRIGGPTTVAEIGPRLGRKANSLHYHLRKLVRAGFVRQVSARRSGARTEAIYDVVADYFSGPSVAKDPKLQKLSNNAVAAILRLAARNFAQATENPALLRDNGNHCNIAAARTKGRLTRAQLAEVNGHLDALRRIFLEGNMRQRGELCALTIVLTPMSASSTGTRKSGFGSSASQNTRKG